MKKLIFNEMEKIEVQDMNDVQEAIHQNLYDTILYNLLGRKNGFLGDSLKPLFVDATHVKVQSGIGFVTDAKKAGYQAQFALVKLLADSTQMIAAADPALPRWDIICVKGDQSVTAQEQRYTKDPATNLISLQTVDKVRDTINAIQVVTGVAGAAPAVPAVPAGYEIVAKIYITPAVGVAASTSVYDARTVLYVPSPSLKIDLPNNQADPMDVTGLFLDKTLVDSAVIPISIYRKTGSSNVKCSGQLFPSYKPDSDSWDCEPMVFGDDCGVTFSVTPAGQVQITTTNIVGANYIGYLRFKVPGLLNQ